MHGLNTILEFLGVTNKNHENASQDNHFSAKIRIQNLLNMKKGILLIDHEVSKNSQNSAPYIRKQISVQKPISFTDARTIIFK
jgi:hypothetical protein